MTTAIDVAGAVVRWQRSHGRHHLPWQGTRDPYRVWLSEVMLQQTQVAAALPYYQRFLERFPDVGALAAADIDEVLALWSGLGYYSRARNLHRCARVVASEHGGRFPSTAQGLQQLPGIGRSTASAIAAFCFGERAAILDGNVKRVLARVLAFGGDLAQASQERRLWDAATGLLPQDPQDMPAYTQGLMDLGATVCLPRQPNCLLCPLQDACAARREQAQDRYPVRSRKLRRTSESWWLLRAQASDGSVWLEKRPTPGVWAGLYCLPAFSSREALLQALPPRVDPQEAPALLHVLTHKDLHLHPVMATVPRTGWKVQAGGWFAPAEWGRLGLPTPVRKLLAV